MFLLLAACGEPEDASSALDERPVAPARDAGLVDATTEVLPIRDAGAASAEDASVEDASVEDAAFPPSPEPDSGSDQGPSDAGGLVSTGTDGGSPPPASECRAQYQDCPNHPAFTDLERSERYQGADMDQAKCLARAKDQWSWCNAIAPIRATYYEQGVAVASAVFPSSELTASGPIVASRDRQIIENVEITSTRSGATAISVNGKRGVVIRHVRILHNGGRAIHIANSPDTRIQSVETINTGAPASGPLPEDAPYTLGVLVENSDDSLVRNVRMAQEAISVLVSRSDRVTVQGLESHDQRAQRATRSDGTRSTIYGNCVQFLRSTYGELVDFACINVPGVSFTGDVVSFFESHHINARRGYLQYGTHPSGAGIMYEESHHGVVQDVDVLAMTGGGFGAFPGHSIVFRNVRLRDFDCTDKGFGTSRTNGLIFVAQNNDAVHDLEIYNATYFNIDASCTSRPPHIFHRPRFINQPVETGEVVEADFTPREPYSVFLPWD